MSILPKGLPPGPGTKVARLARALSADIAAGRLPAGARLPPHRALAHQLGCTPGTVSRAYAELERDGLAAGQVGRGTFVSDPRRPTGLPELTVPERRGSRLYDLAVNREPLPHLRGAMAAALVALARADRLDDVLGYHPAAGPARHRAALAAWLGHGIAADRIIVTAGAQHAAWLVLSALASPGDTVLVEEFTYTGFKALAEELGLRLEPVTMDQDGLLPEALEERLARHGARWLYCMPGLHNPTTARLTPARRAALLGIIARHDLRVIEDGTYDALADTPARPLVADTPERVFHVCSLSKSLAPGLRAGFVVAPAGFVERLARSISRTMWMTPPLGMEICCHWMESGEMTGLLERQRDAFAARRGIAAEELSGLTFRAAAAFLWVDLPAGVSAARVVATAAAAGVMLAPTEAFAVGRRPEADQHLRISLGASASEAELRAALRQVRPLLNAEGGTPDYW